LGLHNDVSGSSVSLAKTMTGHAPFSQRISIGVRSAARLANGASIPNQNPAMSFHIRSALSQRAFRHADAGLEAIRAHAPDKEKRRQARSLSPFSVRWGG